MVNSDVSWQLTLNNACSTTVVNGNNVVVNNMQNSVKAAPDATVDEQIFTAYIDSISATYNSGVALCGPTTYTLGGAYTGANTWMNFDASLRRIRVSTVFDSDINYTPGYTVTIKGCLDNYPGVCSPAQSFTIKILPCKITSFVVNGGTVTPNINQDIFYPAIT